MGTKYYMRQNSCSQCGRCNSDDELHIGKHSWGWAFSFRGHTEPPITTVKDWEATPGEIYDEYGEHQNREEFFAWAKSTYDNPEHKSRRLEALNTGQRIDPEGFVFSFYEYS